MPNDESGEPEKKDAKTAPTADEKPSDDAVATKAEAADEAKSEAPKSDPPLRDADVAEPADAHPGQVVTTHGTHEPLKHPLPAWGDAIARFDQRWVRFETQLTVVVIIGEMLALCAWIFLKGLSTPPGSSAAGIVFRAALTAIVLGAITWRVFKKSPERTRSTITTVAVFVGLGLGRAWASVGVGYTSELINWFQDAHSMTLIGGLRGVGTRLTIWIAMLGASLATSSGKHINIDVVMRFLPLKARVPAAVFAWVAASFVCFTAMWGFVDHIAIANFGAPAAGSVGDKLGAIVHESSEHLFIVRRQFGIDMKVTPRILGGAKYTEALTGAEWNEKIKDGGYESYYTPVQIKALYVPDGTAYVTPLVVIPGKTQRSLLVDDLNLLFPFGFLMIGLKFLIRALLAISGHVVVDPDAAHKDDSHDPSAARSSAEEGSLWERYSSSVSSFSRSSECRCSP